MSTDEQAGDDRGSEDGVGSGPDSDARTQRSARKRRVDYPRRDRNGWRRWVPSWKLVTTLCLGFVGSILAAVTAAYAMVDIPDPTRAAQAQSNTYYWADGSQMAATGGEVNRQIISVEQIPLAMQHAVISAENKTFMTDAGIDAKSVGRAMLDTLRGKESQGGATITQQYVRTTRSPGGSDTLTGRFQELVVSAKVGSRLDKADILSGYLNASYYGRGAYGIQAAARTYYGKDARQLDPGECAFLVSLLKDPNRYDPAGAVTVDPSATPAANTARVQQRWAWVLDEMVKDGHLSAGERSKFTRFPTLLKPARHAQLAGQVGYLVDLAKSSFLKTNTQGVKAEDLAHGGYEIHTTFDKRKVAVLAKAVQQARQAHIDPAKRPHTDTHVQFGGASVDPATGAIVAVYGGEDATRHPTSNADTTGVQAGSAFTPFVLAAALRDGVRDPAGKAEQGKGERKAVDPTARSRQFLALQGTGGRVTGGSLPTEIWRSYMDAALKRS